MSPKLLRSSAAAEVQNAIPQLRADQDKRERDVSLSPSGVPGNVSGAFSTETYDLSAADGEVSTSGYAVHYKRVGSTPGGLLDIRMGGEVFALAPGESLRVPFDRFSVHRNALSVAVGTAVFIIEKRADVQFQQYAFGAGQGGLINQSVAPGGAFTQAINSAAGNVPTTAGDGISLAGARGFRVVLSAAVGQTLSGGGSLVFWKRPTNFNSGATSKSTTAGAGNRWAPTPIKYTDLTDATSLRDWLGPEEEVEVSDGELYIEARSVTASGGAALVVAVEVWG